MLGLKRYSMILKRYSPSFLSSPTGMLLVTSWLL